jgi:hypothetical protein
VNVNAQRAQRWHDTDHGKDRAGPIRDTRYRTALPDGPSEPDAGCWCCCQRCDPDESDRPNPFYPSPRTEEP